MARTNDFDYSKGPLNVKIISYKSAAEKFTDDISRDNCTVGVIDPWALLAPGWAILIITAIRNVVDVQYFDFHSEPILPTTKYYSVVIQIEQLDYTTSIEQVIGMWEKFAPEFIQEFAAKFYSEDTAIRNKRIDTAIQIFKKIISYDSDISCIVLNMPFAN
jgi:hypothetical protein